MTDRIVPLLLAFFGSLVLTLLLTPLVREVNRRLGMVDKPDPRRINKKTIPRGGGLAIAIATIVTYVTLVLSCPEVGVVSGSGLHFFRCLAIALAIAMLGLADDKLSLPPKLKLLGQVLLAFATWAWCGLGFADLWPALPCWLDCLITMFWIVGAVNAFNLIDGLDGLASGLALIATIGIAGSLFVTGNVTHIAFYFVFAGSLLGFLRYNYNPASVFLGDCGSMFIGYLIACLPLCSHTPNSLIVSVGVPLLAMGVPIFDTSLAIIRRSVRRLLNRKSDAGNGEVMTADIDHLHHRILRSVNLNQRKAAWMLYAIAIALVALGMLGIVARSRSAGVWLLVVTIVAVVIFKDLARIELFDTGRLINGVVHSGDSTSRRRWARAAVPFFCVFDISAIVAVYFIVLGALDVEPTRAFVVKTLPVRLMLMMAVLVMARVYVTIWARALISNYIRLIGACFVGATAGSLVCDFLLADGVAHPLVATVAFGVGSATLMVGIRLLRGVVRDAFYAIDCQRLVSRKDVSRILVYGAGLRYRAFRRELVRLADGNTRIIVGILDDDILLRGHYIGGIRVLGTLLQAPDVINRLNVDAVVIACDITDEWMKVVRATLVPTGVKITHFSFNEKEID